MRSCFAVVVALTVVLVVLPFVVGGEAHQGLRDRHSDPAAQVIVATVAVAMSGNLYHDPRCTFIHGPAVLEPLATAIAQGFSPCPRCLGLLRRQP